MKKSELKKIIKECLVEILAEGLGDFSSGAKQNLEEQVLPARKTHPSQHKFLSERKTKSNPRQASNIEYNKKPSPPPQAKQAIQTLANNDPIMSSIFEDTLNTVAEQNSHGHNQPTSPAGGLSGFGDIPMGNGGGASNVSLNNDLFAGAGTWADIAFANKKS